MKSKSIILIAVSLGFGLVAAIGISQVMGRSNAPPPPKKEETKPVLVALEDMDIKTELTEDKIKIEQWPVSLVPPDAITTLEEIKDKALNCRILKRMPIGKTMVVGKNEITALPIPKGFKVVAIKLPADDVFNGLLNPGDMVDLIGVFTNDKSKVSRTFLTGIRVFSVNNRTTAEERGAQQASQGAVVGLLLTKTQAERLILAQKVAQIKLVMRSEEGDGNSAMANNGDGENTDGVNMDDMSEPENMHANNDADDKALNNLLAADRPANDIIHKMVMNTPDGPVSFVFHKDAPLPQRIDGYFNEVPVKKKSSAGTEANTTDDDAIDSDSSETSVIDSVSESQAESVEGSDSAEESNPATNE